MASKIHYTIDYYLPSVGWIQIDNTGSRNMSIHRFGWARRTFSHRALRLVDQDGTVIMTHDPKLPGLFVDWKECGF